jgi:hypothetical protein
MPSICLGLYYYKVDKTFNTVSNQPIAVLTTKVQERKELKERTK